MKILRWMQNKFSDGQEKRRIVAGSSSARYKSAPDVQKAEFDDWQKALLSIGTLANKDLQEDQEDKEELPKNLDSSYGLQDFTTEELKKVKKEITKLLNQKSKSPCHGEEERGYLSLHWFMNCSSCLEVDIMASQKCDDVEGDNNGNVSPNTMIMLNKVKHALQSNCKSIEKKSFSFLFKKAFLCGSGFMPGPSLRDPIAESRLEKILRTILTRKIYPQSFALIPEKKRLNNKPAERNQTEPEEDARKDQGRWVKTDSEYIVLEI